jgi:hypothetical protein
MFAAPPTSLEHLRFLTAVPNPLRRVQETTHSLPIVVCETLSDLLPTGDHMSDRSILFAGSRRAKLLLKESLPLPADHSFMGMGR